MIKPKKIIIISVLAAAAVIAALVRFGLFGRPGEAPINRPKDAGLNGQPVVPAAEPSRPKGMILFKHKNPNFSFEYFNDLTVASSTEAGGAEAIIFSRPGEPAGFQIFLNPLPEAGLLTKEEILSAYPELRPADMREAIIGDGLRAFMFFGQDPAIGKTREVWFAYGQYLYEITGYAAYDSELAYIMSTFKIIN